MRGMRLLLGSGILRIRSVVLYVSMLFNRPVQGVKYREMTACLFKANVSTTSISTVS